MSAIDQLCDKITSEPRFVEDFELLQSRSLKSVLGIEEYTPILTDRLLRLIQAGALFAQSTNYKRRQLAFRIAVESLRYAEDLDGTNNAVRLIFSRLGNYPALAHAFSGFDVPNTIIHTAFMEIEHHKIENTVDNGSANIVLTDTQRDVWRLLTDGRSLALSAPTSSGKSYILKNYIKKIKQQDPTESLLYLVPSRALISQVSSDLEEYSNGYDVITIPLQIDSRGINAPVYVLTPERLQVLFTTSPSIAFSKIVVDEAHLIANGSRGVILHSVLREALERFEKPQFLFLSPQVRDPSIFGSVVGLPDIASVKTRDSPVAQNIIIIKSDAIKTQNIHFSIWNEGRELNIGTIKTAINLYNSHDRLIYLSRQLGRGSQSLIYSDGTATCEKYARRLRQVMLEEQDSLFGTGDGAANPVVSGPDSTADDLEKKEARIKLADFAKEIVHDSYYLAETVLDGIGYHYGRMPAALRLAVEHEFDQGNLDYIVCTSTLLQGVNLPARNIFMFNPMSGEDTPMTSVDFWNLAGRAGRLGRDFQGNVFLVDYIDWSSKPLDQPTDEIVRPALERILTDHLTDFLAYASSASEPSGASADFETTFSKLFRDLRTGRLESTLRSVSGLSDSHVSEIRDVLVKASERISLDPETLSISPQVSAYRQQQLYNYVIDKIAEKGPEYLIPLHPSTDWAKAISKLRPVFARVHKYLELNSNNTHVYWAPLALRWMKGDSYPVLIEAAIRYSKSKGERRSPATIIREVLLNVERGLRFRYVKLIGCYIAVLRRALTDTGYAAYVDRIPALLLYLELGAASQTMISLMGLGLSRHAARIVADLTLNREMGPTEAKILVQSFNVEASELSPYLKSEIQRVRLS
jgi:replicative superfamily II helicase